MNRKEEELQEPILQPTKYSLDDAYKHIDKFNTSSPYLGLVDDIYTDSRDPEYEKRLKKSSRINAFGSVLSSLFDTAVSAGGGMVGRTDQSKFQLKNLEDWNRERVRLLNEQDKMKAAKLQERMLNSRHKVDQENIINKAKLDLELKKADKQYETEEQDRRFAMSASQRKEEKAAEHAHELQLQKMRSADTRYQSDAYRERNEAQAGRTGVGLSLTDSRGNTFNIQNSKVPQLYDLVVKKLSEIPDSSLSKRMQELKKDLRFKSKFETNQIDAQYQKDIITAAFELPEVYPEFQRIIMQTEAPEGNMVMQSAGGTGAAFNNGRQNLRSIF